MLISIKGSDSINANLPETSLDPMPDRRPKRLNIITTLIGITGIGYIISKLIKIYKDNAQKPPNTLDKLQAEQNKEKEE